MTPELWQHQSRAIEKATPRSSLALLFDPGTGKTRTTIEILQGKFRENGAQFPVVIFCPPVVIANWAIEWAKFGSAENILPLTGSKKKRLADIKAAPSNAIFITNYEALLMEEIAEELRHRFRHTRTSAVVFDESHKVKDIKSKRTKVAIGLSDFFTFRYILTGTPVLKNYLDIFTQFRILDKNIFGHNYYIFRSKYFYDKNSGMPSHRHFPLFEIKPEAEKELKAVVDSNSSFAKKSECLDLPPLVKVVVPIEMGTEQRRLYEQMKKSFVATVTDSAGNVQRSIAELVITKALRLQQIVSGHLKIVHDDGSAISLRIKENPRRDALKQLLEDLTPQHKVIVWAVFKDNYIDIREVCKELKIKYTELTGETKDKQSSVNRFTNDDNVRVCIGNPSAGGVGVNLISASYAIYYSRNFSLESDVQSEARNYRGGSEIHEKITRIDLVATQTIDEVVLKALANKQELSDNILRQKIMEL